MDTLEIRSTKLPTTVNCVHVHRPMNRVISVQHVNWRNSSKLTDQSCNFPPSTFARVAQLAMTAITAKLAWKDISGIPSMEFGVVHVHVAIIRAIQSLDVASNVIEILKVGSVISARRAFIHLIPNRMVANFVRVRVEPSILSAIRQLQHAHASQITRGNCAMIALPAMQIFRWIAHHAIAMNMVHRRSRATGRPANACVNRTWTVWLVMNVTRCSTDYRRMDAKVSNDFPIFSEKSLTALISGSASSNTKKNVEKLIKSYGSVGYWACFRRFWNWIWNYPGMMESRENKDEKSKRNLKWSRTRNKSSTTKLNFQKTQDSCPVVNKILVESIDRLLLYRLCRAGWLSNFTTTERVSESENKKMLNVIQCWAFRCAMFWFNLSTKSFRRNSRSVLVGVSWSPR